MSNLVKKTNQKKHITQNQRKQREEKENEEGKARISRVTFFSNFTTA